MHWYVYAFCIANKGNRLLDSEAWQTLLNDFDNIANGVDSNGDYLFTDSDGDHWGGVFLFSLADLKQNAEGYGMQHYKAADQMCWGCLANRLSRPFTNCYRNAAWRPTADENLTNEVECLIVRVFDSAFLVDV